MNRREGALTSRMELPGAGVRRSNLQPVPDPDEPFFPVALRGYDRQAVDDYVEDVSRLIAELEVTPPEQTAVKEALERVGEDTSGILQHAHETAESITARAQAQAEREVQDAERDAERIRAEAEARAQQLANDTQDVWRERGALLDDVRRLAEGLLEVADAGVERLPDLPVTFASGNGAYAASVPPPPPPPGEETTQTPPPPDPAPRLRGGADGAVVDGAVVEDGDPAPGQPFAHADFDGPPPAPRRPQPPRRAGQVGQPTEQMDALPHEGDPGFKGQRFSAFWERRSPPEH